ncbi:Na(+)/H(+) exchange regulatory cofactor NHE-RF1-like [Chiloscyllium plagiosum]|uniref:Na(+)/H(+) exchange regulatory cofactor NHE-RF1-like n=1 Tax=Chiloscyllium plagiosum TaxID=36176 RepID=UPI001CB87441|nr:Na(+)/H(+) exchange regulatory cofactor NHE-RF1-like [Chiloscyllium plagiosum]
MTKEQLRPRLCIIEKGPSGYGFHLHGEKGKTGQFIRLVEAASPAERAGLRAGDKVVQVNGDNVEQDSHQQVVQKIKAVAEQTRLLVVDRETDDLLRARGLVCKEEYIDGIPDPTESGEVQQEEPEEKSPAAEPKAADTVSQSSSEKEVSAPTKELRPRLCRMQKGSNGYGFNLHSEKSKVGQYIRAVDADSPAERSGLLPQDRIIEVNGESVEGKQHSDVVTAIKTGGTETSLLVVDPETDEFFKKCNVPPSVAHLTGPLPQLIVNGDIEQKANGDVSATVTPTPAPSSNSSSAPSTPTTPSRDTSAPVVKPQPESDNTVDEVGLSLSTSAAEAKEKVHSKRSSKRAPQMDWSKKNELFSNL